MSVAINLPKDERHSWPMPGWRFFDSQNCFRGSHFEIEIFDPFRKKMVKTDVCEGDCDHLYNSRANRYRHHPVTAIIEFLRLSRFAHISIEEAASVFDRTPREHEMPRYSEGHIFNLWINKFGLYCRACKQIKMDEADRHAFMPGHSWWWHEHEMCEPCVIELRKDGHQALKKERAAREFRRRTELLSEQIAQQRLVRTTAKKKRRQLERAAYEILDEMGVLRQLEEAS